MKRCAVISTCLAIGAIHFEVAPSLDSGSFTYTPRRFIARQAVRCWSCARTMGRKLLEPSGSGTSLALNDQNNTYTNLDEEGFHCVLIVKLNPSLTVDRLPKRLRSLMTWENYSEPLVSVEDEDEEDVFAHLLWRQVQHTTDLFCKRWVKEYLTKLQESQS